MLTGTTTLQAELKKALDEANRCSVCLEFLLKEARDSGGASLEMFTRITHASKRCEEAIERYLIIYSAFNNCQWAKGHNLPLA